MGTTIFAEMSALAGTTGSVNLGQGFPDTDGPREIAAAAAAAIMEGRGNQYPPGPGIPELRQAVAAHQKRFYGLDVDPDAQVLVTAGATEAIAAALLALLEPGDEAIAFEPYYDSYAACIAMAGATRVPVTLRPPDFRPDLDALRAAITGRTRLILLNTPHNPTGVVFTPDELARIAELACSRDLLVVSDEVYEHMVYDGVHLPIVSLPGMSQRTVTISSGAKTFAFTGWKIGWVTGSPELVTAVRTVKQFLTYVTGGPFQYAVAEALALPDGYYASISTDLRVKRDFMCAGLAGPASRSTGPPGPSSSPPMCARWATPTACSSAGNCRAGPAWWLSPASCSTTTPTWAGRRCGSLSARSSPCWPRRWTGWRASAAAGPGRKTPATAGRAEGVRSRPGRAEGVRSRPGRAEGVRSRPGRAEGVRSRPGRAEEVWPRRSRAGRLMPCDQMAFTTSRSTSATSTRHATSTPACSA